MGLSSQNVYPSFIIHHLSVIAMLPWKETQRFADRAIIVILGIPILASFLIGIYYQSSTSLLIVVGSLVFVGLLMASLKLEVRVDEHGIYFKYFPFHLSEQHIPWEKIRVWRIIKVNAIKDFGGMGIKYTSKKKGFIINSNFGLEIEQTNNRIIVISITDKAKAEAALQHYHQKNKHV